MKKTQSLLIFGLILLGTAGCKPDLKVSYIKITGTPTENAAHQMVVPVSVMIINLAPKDIDEDFYVTVSATDSAGDQILLPFVAGSQVENTRVQVNGLALGTARLLDGDLTIPDWLRYSEILLTATVDSCAGVSGMPSYCRIDESDEENNVSDPISLVIP